jgi:hypothetical protein
VDYLFFCAHVEVFDLSTSFIGSPEKSNYCDFLQMSKRLGLVYNPEALELWAMNKLFVIHEWLEARNVAKPSVKLNNMLRMIGFSISDQLYDLIEKYPHP